MAATRRRNRRKSRRNRISVDGMIYTGDGAPLLACRLRNVSAGGAQLELAQDMAMPRSFILSLSRTGGVRRACRTVWQLATVVGIRFDATPAP
jgi:hypothetical protein